MRKLRLKTKPDEGKVPNDVARWVETYVERRLAEEKKAQSFGSFTTLIGMVTLAEAQYVSSIALYHQMSKSHATFSESWIQAWSNSDQHWTVSGVEEDIIQSNFRHTLGKIDHLAASLASEDLKAYKEYRKKTQDRVEAPFGELLREAREEAAGTTQAERSWVRRLDAADDLDFEL